jgi:hypothetical protein
MLIKVLGSFIKIWRGTGGVRGKVRNFDKNMQ